MAEAIVNLKLGEWVNRFSFEISTVVYKMKLIPVFCLYYELVVQQLRMEFINWPASFKNTRCMSWSKIYLTHYLKKDEVD